MEATATKLDTIGPAYIADRISTAAALLDSVRALTGAYSAELDVGQFEDHRVLLELHARGWRIVRCESPQGEVWYSARLRYTDRHSAEHRVSWWARHGNDEQIAELEALVDAEGDAA